MKNDAIIFDIDGTLWNASPASAKGWNIGLAKLGIDKKVTVKQIESVTGQPYEKCVEILLPGPQTKYPRLLATLNDCEIEVVKTEGGKFYDSVIDGIKYLAGSYKVFLVSNCQEEYLNLFLDFSGLKSILAGFDCHESSKLSKDEMLKKIKCDYSLNNPVYIGDTAGDEEAANSAKMEFIHVSYGFGAAKNKPRSFNTFTALVDYFMR